jgi:hypothetical protein
MRLGLSKAGLDWDVYLWGLSRPFKRESAVGMLPGLTKATSEADFDWACANPMNQQAL